MNFAERRQMALAMLNDGRGLNGRSGSFLGQIAVDERPLSDKQAAWFGKLVDRFNDNQGEANA